MKRFGLKAIAAAMALLMTASLSAPAAAEAADKLLLTSAGSNVLVITQDMVDSEGEFVLSGEDFDKVILPADVTIKNLYVDGCEIGEFTVEGGNNPKVQLWDAQIKNVTVSAANMIDENKAIAEFMEAMRNETSKDTDVEAFVKNVRETNERLAKLVPDIRLMGADMASSEQEIGEVTLAGNAKVNFTKGTNPGKVNVAFKSAQEEMNVTIEGYKGDINVEQTTSVDAPFGVLNLRTKKSEIGDVNVNTQGNANIVLRSTDSKAANVNFNSSGAGSTVLTLSAPTDNLKVAGSASNATVKVLTSLISADVQGKGINMNVGASASVEKATIGGTGNSVSGTGDLKDCTISDGATANVQVPGSTVAGNNTYTPSVFVPSIFVPSTGVGGNTGSGSTGGSTDGNTGVDLTGATLCTPNQWEVVLFTGVDLREYAGKNVNISAEVVRVGGESDPVAHGQFNDSNWTAIYYNSKSIGAEWTDYGKSNYAVPESFKDEEKAVYYGIRTADGVDYSPYKIYYKNFKVTVVGEENNDDEISNVDLTGATLCTPNQWEVALFTDTDFREYAGKTVNISVEAVRVGGESDPVAHGQFNDSNWTAIYYNSKNIGSEWTDYGKLNYVVPESFATEEKAVYYGLRSADGVDYSPYKIYYRNFKVEVVGGESSGGSTEEGGTDEGGEQNPPAVTEIIIDSAANFTKTVANDGEGFFLISETWLNSYEGGNNFVALLPEALKQNNEIAQKFTTLAGIKELVKHFEFSLTLTESKKAETSSEPITAHSLVITSDQAGEWVANWSSNYLTFESSSTINDQVNVSDWDAVNIEAIRLRIKNLEEGSTVSGSYSIKAILN